MRRRVMKSKSYLMTSSKILPLVLMFMNVGFLLLAKAAAPETKENATDASSTKQKQFATPKEAVNSLVAAAETFDVPALKEILGPDGEDLVSSEDPVMDKN